MNKQILFFCLLIFVSISCQQSNENSQTDQPKTTDQTLRFVSFNSSLNRNHAGELLEHLKATDSIQIQRIAEIIQRTRPDVMALLEFDYYPNNQAVDLFQTNYLSKAQCKTCEPIDYPYRWAVPSNTGVETGLDLDKNGETGTPNDAMGYGKFEGQFAFAIFSKYPLKLDEKRTFQNFLWKDMPNNVMPVNPENSTTSYYPEEVVNVLRLSSKNHIDLPIDINGKIVHLLVAHPTPPVFDGPEDRNGRRNYDEIRLLADYISGGNTADYLTDDQGKKGGLAENASFVVMGDMNADPKDGDQRKGAIQQLVEHPNVNREATLGAKVPRSEGSLENSQQEKHKNDKTDLSHDTSGWGLRVDYIIPSKDIKVKDSGVFWPTTKDSTRYLMENSSDHRLLWMDLVLSEKWKVENDK